MGEGSDDWGLSVPQTLDEGYIIIGGTDSFGEGVNNIWLIKTNVSGDLLWTKRFGGSGYIGGYSFQQTKDGGYIITGGDWQPSEYSKYDVWLIKTDASGNTLWIKKFGGSSVEVGYSVQQTIDGNRIYHNWTYMFIWSG